MEDMALAHVNPKMLAWAREKAQMTPEQAAKGLAAAERIIAWESGTQVPKIDQAEKLAARLGVTFMSLFLTVPPSEEPTAVPDKRTLKDAKRRALSANFKEVLNHAIVRQDWYREEFPKAAPRIGSKHFLLSSTVTEIAAFLKSTLRISDDLRSECRDWNEFLKKLVHNAEEAGVIVMRSGLVRNNTKRSLSVEEFRGFALADPVAPLIFINSNDATVAQIFTLIHELAHLTLNRSAVSNPDPTKGSEADKDRLEKLCNMVAAEVLVPEAKFNRAWKRDLPETENLKRIVRFFKVSKIVALRRAHDLGKMDSASFFQAVEQEYRRWRKKKDKEDEEEAKTSKGGPALQDMLPIRNGRRLTESVLVAVRGNRVAYTEAASLLGVKTPTLEKYARGQVA